MKRGSFALSWGRKIFFGVSWPLTLAISFIYLKSFNLPSGPTEIIFYLLNIIGVTGVLNAIAYFAFFAPVALLMPTYYICRFWSLLIILILNVAVFADALFYASYRVHVQSFLSKLLINEGIHFIPGIKEILFGISIFFLVFALFTWLRGERIWRYMKGRFTNPVSNWYLYFMLIFLVISQTMYYKININPQLANLFPVSAYLKRPFMEGRGSRGIFNYPNKKIVCNYKKNPNLVLITIKNWNHNQLNQELMPVTSHLKEHGNFYQQHFSASSESAHSLFTLLFGIPASYYLEGQDKRPAFHTELSARQYEILDASKSSEEESLQGILNWVDSRNEDRPFYISLAFNEASTLTDEKIASLVLKFQLASLLENTYLIFTGGSSGEANNYIVPLIIIGPEKEVNSYQHVTSHYDVMPTMMSKMWGCKNSYMVSFSRHLDDKNRDWLMNSDMAGIKIWDFKKSNFTNLHDDQIEDKSLNGNNKPDRSLILEALKIDQKFFNKL